jgi:TolA-binding protein
MKRLFLITFIALVAMISCNQVNEKNKKVLVKNINELENKYFTTDKFNADKNQIDTMINAYSNFIEKFKDDSLTAGYMFKKANLYSTIQDYNNAVKVFDDICTNYPNFEKRPEALFYEAMIYGDYLKNEVMAQRKYEEFINDYPNHDLRDDAEKSIEFLGKTDAEIIEILTRKDTLQ